MAKLFSSPKLPALPAIQAAPEVTPPPAAPALPAEPEPTATAAVTTTALTEQLAATSTVPDSVKALELTLARRERGRTGTVLTSWRGVLEPGALAPVRKNLLGE